MSGSTRAPSFPDSRRRHAGFRFALAAGALGLILGGWPAGRAGAVSARPIGAPPDRHVLSGARGGPAPEDTLILYFTAETRGNLEPCACPSARLGGLARRCGFLLAAGEKARARGRTALVLDAGGFLPDGEVPLRDAPGVGQRFTSLLLRGLERSGAQAIALDPGQRQFLERAVPDETRDLGSIFLEADPPSAPRVLEWDEHHVAIIALEETSADDAVRASGTAARARGNLVIALARADALSGRRLARLSGADLVILSRGARLPAPITEGPARLVGCGVEGREVGEIRVVVDRATRGHPATPRITDFCLHPMDESIRGDSDIASRVEALVRDAGPRVFARSLE